MPATLCHQGRDVGSIVDMCLDCLKDVPPGEDNSGVWISLLDCIAFGKFRVDYPYRRVDSKGLQAAKVPVVIVLGLPIKKCNFY